MEGLQSEIFLITAKCLSAFISLPLFTIRVPNGGSDGDENCQTHTKPEEQYNEPDTGNICQDFATLDSPVPSYFLLKQSMQYKISYLFMHFKKILKNSHSTTRLSQT